VTDKFVSGGYATCPTLALPIETELIGFRRIDSNQSNFGRSDFYRIPIDDPRNANKSRIFSRRTALADQSKNS
jgi:hypothetical protein